MIRSTDAYLDIETTGLSPYYDTITVIGIFLCNGRNEKLVQLVGDQVTLDNLLAALKSVRMIYTYNGRRFDLPFIESYLGVDLSSLYYHHDLMYDCHRLNLRGGFKAVERQLHIPRKLQDISGFDAVLLWDRYEHNYDRDALDLLLQYNSEDVVNLKILRERLAECSTYLYDRDN